MDKKQSILIADDDPQGLAILQQIMLSQGYEVFTASDGTTALAAIEEKKPDLIILDNYMPGMSGSEIAAQLNPTRKPASYPLLCSPALPNPDKLESIEAGADDFITSPTKPLN